MVLVDNIFPATPSGKIELKSETLAKRWGAAALLPGWRERDAPHPLMLISPSSDKRISSTLGGLIGSREAPPLLMNPKDAAQRSLGHGIDVRIWNDRGEVILPLEVTDDVPNLVGSPGLVGDTTNKGEFYLDNIRVDPNAEVTKTADTSR